MSDGDDLKDFTNNFLEHYGVRGMRWGVTNTIRSVSKSKPKKKTTGDHRKSREIQRQRTPQLTNRQLELANKRLNLERNFNRLNPGRITRGQAAVAGILGTLGVATSAYNMSNSPAGRAAIRRGRQMMGQAQRGQQSLF